MTVVLVGAVIGIWLCALWCLLTDPTPVPPSHEPPSGLRHTHRQRLRPEGARRMKPLPVHVQVSEYTVNVVPETYPEHHVWAVTINYRGHGRWAVERFGGAYCLIRSGRSWAHNRQPSSRGDHWLDRHRFADVEEALAAARKVAPKVVINDKTGEQYMHWYDARHGAA